jgi:very-short-patch-repair endonuclease
MAGPDLRRAFHEIGRTQYGLVARFQLLRSGFSDRTIDNRIGTLELVRMLPGVYSLGEPSITQELLWTASALAHPGSVISHRSASAVWGLEKAKGTIEVSRIHSQRLRTKDPEVPEANAPRLNRPLIHGPRGLLPEDIALCRGIPVTSVPRTILDAASTATLSQLDDLVDSAVARRLIDSLQLRALLDRTRGRRGGGKLRAVISDVLIPEGDLRSELELRGLKLLRDHPIPTPLTNQIVGGIEVDCIWPEYKLIVEWDGRRTHDNGRAFEQDRERDALLGLLGYRVLRLTWRMVTREPMETVAKIRGFLATPPN